MNSFEFGQLEVSFNDKEPLHSIHIMNSEDSYDTLFNEKEVTFSENKSNDDYLFNGYLELQIKERDYTNQKSKNMNQR